MKKQGKRFIRVSAPNERWLQVRLGRSVQLVLNFCTDNRDSRDDDGSAFSHAKIEWMKNGKRHYFPSNRKVH